MRFKDYIVNKAIKINYNNYINGKESKDKILDKVFTNVSKKLGYKILDEIVYKKSIPCSNGEWYKILSRYAYKDKRFLEYDMKNKFSIYYDENGMLYSGNGSTFTLLSPIEYYEIYSKNAEFLNYSKKYFKEIIDKKKQYLMIGYNKNKMYYICNDGKFYYKESDSGPYIYCKDDNKIINKYLIDLG